MRIHSPPPFKGWKPFEPLSIWLKHQAPVLKPTSKHSVPRPFSMAKTSSPPPTLFVGVKFHPPFPFILSPPLPVFNDRSLEQLHRSNHHFAPRLADVNECNQNICGSNTCVNFYSGYACLVPGGVTQTGRKCFLLFF